MSDTSIENRPLMYRIEHFGDARKLWKWPDRNPDYMAELRLSLEDVPALIEIART